jgi:hypothetical protein
MTAMEAWNLQNAERVLSRVFPGIHSVLQVYTAMGSTFVRIQQGETGEVTVAYPSDLRRLNPRLTLGGSRDR